jgi:hypothetical protein
VNDRPVTVGLVTSADDAARSVTRGAPESPGLGSVVDCSAKRDPVPTGQRTSVTTRL